ncbi:TPA: TrmB family transcriptional regulator [Staphylococcus aureus]|uniref:TrmB family transcriptional regulator n=1 Tax=Staphylococcus aureus TaxID=1280 RepID=UPI000D1B31DF|nr:TrmB family transcriptional regulator [Staphylococcus aureus]MDP2462624.1 TrmB family transcriptional regulator [Staphylococcus aureus]HDF6772470.1 TrmB family transcriptional regulator [Staphylococcus aureus]HDF7329077.1 TrmB family transcriptional regulator [Staphylococcus aureus]HDG4019535.1 TrmB family transcriptional regulator [Staphylococcus aureus]HDH2251125.1 TrmB family transcriptional regulator [Staphylococcus aureus]
MTLQQKILSHFATYDNFNSDDVVEVFGISKTHAKSTLSRLKKKGKIELESWGIWRVVEPQLHLSVVERKKEILEEQFELLARLNEQSDDPREIEERIKLMIRLANQF